MARIAIIDFADGSYQVNLTNSQAVWEKRLFTAPGAALAYVTHLQERGHKVCFPTALADLRDEAEVTAGSMAAD